MHVHSTEPHPEVGHISLYIHQLQKHAATAAASHSRAHWSMIQCWYISARARAGGNSQEMSTARVHTYHDNK